MKDVLYCEDDITILGKVGSWELIIGNKEDPLNQNPYSIPKEIIYIEKDSKLIEELFAHNPLIEKDLGRNNISESALIQVIKKARDEEKQNKIISRSFL